MRLTSVANESPSEIICCAVEQRAIVLAMVFQNWCCVVIERGGS